LVAGTITALKFQQRNTERVSVYLDGEYAFGLPALEAARLRRGQVLSDAEITALRALDESERAFDQAVRYLSYRPRSRAEIAQYLRRKQLTEDVASDVVQRLEQAGYLDDAAFARFWVDNRQRFRPRSRRALSYELRQKGVGREVAADVVDDQDDEVAAWQAIENRLSRWNALSGDELRQKISGFLARRGFGYASINQAYRRACRELQIED
jgi:regulatory protein